MVNTAEFYKHAEISWNTLGSSDLFVKRILDLLDEVVERLPDEEQFKITCNIIFDTRQGAIKFWQHRKDVDFSSTKTDGVTIYKYSLNRDKPDDRYTITIITDNLDSRTDDYIKGLIAHELSEMSYPFRMFQKNWDSSLRKMKTKDRQVMMAKWTNAGTDFESKEYQKHEEDDINNEAIRLGFQKEIDALEA